VNWSVKQLAVFEAIKAGESHLMIDAVAGSGKTTTILEAMRHVPEGLTVLFVAFSKDIAKELARRAPEGVKVSTLHALGFASCRRNMKLAPPPRTVDGDRPRNIAKRVTGADLDWSKNEWCSAVVKTVSLAKNCLASTAEEIDALIDRYGVCPPQHEGERPEFIQNVRAVMAEMLGHRPGESIDFDDMVWMPIVKNFSIEQFDRIFVDETQDLNASQIELVRKALKPGGLVCAVGDPRQAIYQFRGACADAFEKVRDAFDAKVLPLSVTYRCAKAVVREAQSMVPHLEAAPDAEEGKVEAVGDARMIAEAKAGDFILSRINAPLMKLCLAFLRDGRRAAIQGRDVGTKLASVVKRAKKPDVDGMLAYVDKWATKEIERLEKRDRDASGIADIRECILALSEGETETQAVVAKIERLFADGNETTRITLSSTHRAKGMERDRVWLLRETYLRTRSRKTGRGTVEYIEPGIEEHNLYYVATTRARRELFLVRGAA
jgi:DNA helicase-2/ATP-dependent DNA helicase PcrA